MKKLLLLLAFIASVSLGAQGDKLIQAHDGDLTIGGDVTFNGTISGLPAATDTVAGTLKRYEEGTFTTNYVGATVVSIVVHEYTIIGNRVFFTFPSTAKTTDATDTIRFNTALPSKLQPIRNMKQTLRLINNAAGEAGYLAISSAGAVTIFPTSGGGNFSGGAYGGVDEDVHISWRIANN